MPKAGPGRAALHLATILALLCFAPCALSVTAEPRDPAAQAQPTEKKADQPAVPQPPPPTEAKEAPEPDIVQVMTQEAERLKPWVSSGLARSFLGAASELPIVTPRTLYRDAARTYYSEQAAAALPEAERGALEKVEADSETYYTTKYGSPLAYVRAFDLVARHGFDGFAGKRILDFGYGTVGHLALIASLGGEAVGVDVDSFLTALYSHPDDQGLRKSAAGVEGRIRLVDGHWPDGKGVGEAVGGGYDLFISKNTLKRGYIHPEREVDPKRLVHLEVDDATFLLRLHETLKPGGLAIIYNLSPAQNPPDQPWIPWADGHCPFARDVIEKAGFEVLIYDEDDSTAAREMGRRLEWDKSGMDLEKSLFGHVTIFRKPGAH